MCEQFVQRSGRANGPLTGRDDRADLYDDVVGCSGDGAFLDVEAILTDPGRDNGVEVWIYYRGQVLSICTQSRGGGTLTTRDHRRDGETAPFVTASRQSEQRNQQRQTPELANNAVPSALHEVIAAESERQHEDDLQHSRRDREHVTVEFGEPDTPKRQGKIGLHWRGGNVCHQADEVQSPHRLVLPGVDDVAERGWLFQGCDTLCWIIAQDAVDHDHLFAFCVPSPTP
jgi:hypothetical protein